MLAQLLGVPLGYIIRWSYSLCGNFTSAIILFTFLTKVILFPVSLWTHRNSLTMVGLMPELNRLKIKYYGDKDTIAEETQALYKREHYHPLVSTIPMFIQLALLIGVIGAVRELLTGTESMLSVYPAQTGGITLLMPLAAGMAALVLGLAQNRINPLQREQSKASQWMTNGLSMGISLALGAFVPIGVGIYWIASNLLTILQQLVLNAVMPPKKYVDYAELRESQRELEEMDALSTHVSKEDKRREKEDYKRFFSIANKHLVFYSEKSGFYKYFQDVIEYLLSHSNIIIHYVTSDPKDQIFDLAKSQPHIRPYYIGERKLITLMMKMDADMVVMTMPDLDNFHIKRSYVRKDVEYVYMFHWCTSTHMVIREHALDHYDTIFCPGPHQMEELRCSERMYRLPEKRLVETSYGVIERLAALYGAMDRVQDKNMLPQVLIAPSHQDGNIMDSCIDQILEVLLPLNIRIIVRPHPQYIRRSPQKLEAFQRRYRDYFQPEKFILETDFSSGETVYRSNIVLTDWSTIAYEFALTTLKPALFIDTPMKVINPHYTDYPMKPLDITLRGEIGIAVKEEEIPKLPDIVQGMLKSSEQWQSRILSVRQDIMPRFGRSGELGGKYIVSELVKRKKNNSIER